MLHMSSKRLANILEVIYYTVGIDEKVMDRFLNLI